VARVVLVSLRSSPGNHRYRNDTGTIPSYRSAPTTLRTRQPAWDRRRRRRCPSGCGCFVPQSTAATRSRRPLALKLERETGRPMSSRQPHLTRLTSPLTSRPQTSVFNVTTNVLTLGMDGGSATSAGCPLSIHLPKSRRPGDTAAMYQQPSIGRKQSIRVSKRRSLPKRLEVPAGRYETSETGYSMARSCCWTRLRCERLRSWAISPFRAAMASAMSRWHCA
jgi:hypothetical protein